ncbi:CoB--CoM heterodisulfide reductase subunit B [candidate division KSB1 bacterium]|nr:MAG: CoB--CoM heterodisulfide reductase subunit B [candidate division KSB1 bacterium]
MKYIPFFGCMISMKYPQFEASVRKTMPNIGVELVDVKGFTCCPDPIYFKAEDKIEWLTIAGRNICLAEEAGYDIITMCSGCTATLSEANHILKENPDVRNEINKRLSKINKKFEGSISVRHIVTVIRDDIGIDKVKESVINPLEDLKVAIHYGCHLLKPSRIMQVDDPDHPTILEDLVSAIGATPLEHEERLLCCGKACMSEEIPPKMVYDVLSSIEKIKADCMGLICPTCFDEYDIGQIRVGRKFNKKFNIPIIYYFQLLGIAQGFKPEEMGLHRHKVKADYLFKEDVKV